MEGNAKEPAIRTIMMPRDTNPLGCIFGGHIVSLIDQAAVQCAMNVANCNFVTKLIREVEFIEPVNVGDVVSFYGAVISVGRTSICVRIEVEAQHMKRSMQPKSVTSAELVLVAVDDRGRPVPVEACDSTALG
ncbi:MAG: acyl-CoA thioesterase [Bdellovibrionales bacterium]|nr:acyl-CoA thioesterase [Bdellovibrionales bacterium]